MRAALFALYFLGMLVTAAGAQGAAAGGPPATSPEQLRAQLQALLEKTHTPAMSIALIEANGSEWVTGLGRADVATGRAATAGTLFRLASISKTFVAVAVMELVREGRLSLDDPVRRIAPEVWFENRWEQTDPVRVVNLLEHTTGWDEMPLSEYTGEGRPLPLRAALEIGRSSRVSRWPPGTRMAYCNSGPAVAAYLVEKITGKRFEDYVTERVFEPIGMSGATYFQPPAAISSVLYHADGLTAFPDWNVPYRPAAGASASATGMARYLHFLLNRGSVGGVQVLPPAAVERMEQPHSSWAAREQLQTGYGLGNFTSIHDGFVYHGHNGVIAGDRAELEYLPEYGAGYFFAINAANDGAAEVAARLIRAYLTRNLVRHPLPAALPLPTQAADYAGWYEVDSPRESRLWLLERLSRFAHVRVASDRLWVRYRGKEDQYVAVQGMQFRRIPIGEAPDPAATLALLKPNAAGRFIQIDWLTLKRVPAWAVAIERTLTLYVMLALIAVLLYAPVWILAGLWKRRRRPAERPLRLWPLVAAVSLLGAVIILAWPGDDSVQRLGDVTIWSVGLCLATIIFATASLKAALCSYRGFSGGTARRAVHWFARIVSAALVIATVYLTYWGGIGLRTWA